ncbi:MAG: sulfate/molybdate ABC transporter ATP-binding protein [Eubacteriaceae bacterium]
MGLYVDIEKRLNNFSLKVKFHTETDMLGLLGASGSGKSMTLKCIAGLETPDKGRIIINNNILYDSKKNINIPIRKRKIGFLFQDYALFPHLTVRENIGFGIMGITRNEKNEKIDKIIKSMRLDGLQEHYPCELSGGQQQRIALARALILEPNVLLLDEPLSALDNYLRLNILAQLEQSLSNYKGSSIYVTHNMEEAYRLCSNITILDKGKQVEVGSKEDVFNKPSSISSAIITGCKNISPIKYIGDNIIHAIKWNCNVKVNIVDNEATYVGIRAHHIRICNDRNESNCLNCWPVYVNESPFSVTVYLSIEKPPVDDRKFHIQWEISRERWEFLKNKTLPWKIQISCEKLMLFKK